MKALLKASLLFFSLSLLLACSDVTDGRVGGGDDPDPGDGIFDGPAAGQIDGAVWEFKSGRAEIGQINGNNVYIVELWDQVPNDICNPFTSVNRGIRFSVPVTPNDYDIGPSQPLSFYVDNTSSVVRDEGLIRISGEVEENGDLYVEGGINAVYDAANIANGQFSVILCE